MNATLSVRLYSVFFAFLIAALLLADSTARADDEGARRIITPVPLVLDMGLDGDPDEVLAMGLIHALQSNGKCRLLAVTVQSNDLSAGSLVDLINTFYGRGDIPLGVAGEGELRLRPRPAGMRHQGAGGGSVEGDSH